MNRTNGNRPRYQRRDLLALVPRVDAHPTHAVVDGVAYPGGLAEYTALTGHNPAAPTYLDPIPNPNCVCVVGPGEWSGSQNADNPDGAWDCDDCGRTILAEPSPE